MKKVEKATRNGNGNSRLAEQMSIIGSNNNAKKEAYIKRHTIMTDALPELFRSKNLKCAVLYLKSFAIIPPEVAQAAHKAGRSGLLKGMAISAA